MNYSEAKFDAAISGITNMLEALDVPIKKESKTSDARPILDGRVAAIQAVAKIAMGLRAEGLVGDDWIEEIVTSLDSRAGSVKEAFITILGAGISMKFADKDLKKISEGKLYAFQKINEIDLAISEIKNRVKEMRPDSVPEESSTPSRIELFAKRIS